MSEETNDGTWSGLKKTIIATLTTIITAAGAYVGTTLFGGHESSEETKTEQVAPVQQSTPAPITINVQQNQENTQQQKQQAAPTTIIKERVIEKPVKEETKKEQPKEEEAPW